MQTVDVAGIIERQKLSRFLIGLVVVSWIITFFDGFDANLIGFAARYLASEYHLSRVEIGNIFAIGLMGTLIGGFALGYLGDKIGRRPGVILATVAARRCCRPRCCLQASCARSRRWSGWPTSPARSPSTSW